MTKRYETLTTPGHVESLVIREIITAEVFRPLSGGGYPDEPSEVLCVGDLIVTAGLNYIAARIASGDTVNSAMNYMAVGTVSTAATYTDTGLTGEVKRKALCTNSATANVYSAVCTLGGAADSVTSLQIQEAGLFNHAGSGQGTMMQRVTISTWTPANSDLLKLTLQTNVGSR